jgi:8-oxo-dGTP pyrophosphatase MutT (NUDIX family)/phosphohistidine phosphatase SixA
MSATGQIVSAGAVVARKASGSPVKGALEILMVHRPKYDDWSFPKGKLDLHEHPTTAAVREVAEETGLDIRLGPPLSTQTYQVRNGRTRTKHVHYWAGRLVNGDDISGYDPNDEIDSVAWVGLDKARKQLTYPHDRDTLEEFLAYRKKSFPLVVLRHAKARARTGWHQDDRERPLTRAGEFQSEQLVPILASYGVTRLVSSSSRRCWTTIGPYAEVADLEIEETPDLAEEDATAETVEAVVSKLVSLKEPSVLCTHRPVMPMVWSALGLEPHALEPGSLVVVHHRRGRVLAVEAHAAPSGR